MFLKLAPNFLLRQLHHMLLLNSLSLSLYRSINVLYVTLLFTEGIQSSNYGHCRALLIPYAVSRKHSNPNVVQDRTVVTFFQDDWYNVKGCDA